MAQHYEHPVNCAIGGYVYFAWHAVSHDLTLMASAAHMDRCDFSGSATLVGVNASAVGGITYHYLPCDHAGTTLHVACSIADHCARGQKLTIQVSTSEYAISPTDATTVLLHSDSLARVMRLLHYRADAHSGFAYLDGGYSSEAAAEVTLEMIWCLEAHCPDSAFDWDPFATRASCLADVYNLGGFVSRKRPQPQYAHAEAYYLTALSHVPTHCPTLGYLAELHLMMSNASAAADVALSLCGHCGHASVAAQQLRASFNAADVPWACIPPSAPPLSPPPFAPPLSPPLTPPRSPPTSPPPALPPAPLPTLPPSTPPPPPFPPLSPDMIIAHEVRFTMIVAGSVESVNRTAVGERVASELEVDPQRVQLDVSAASVEVRVTIMTESAEAAQKTQSTLLSHDATTLGSVLDISVLLMTPPVAETVVVVRTAPPVAPTSLPPTHGGAQPMAVFMTIAFIVAGVIGAFWMVVIVMWILFTKRPRRHNQRTVTTGDACLPAKPGQARTKRSRGDAATKQREGPRTQDELPVVLATPPTNLHFVPRSTASNSSDWAYGEPFSPAAKLVAMDTPRKATRHPTRVTPELQHRSTRISPALPKHDVPSQFMAHGTPTPPARRHSSHTREHDRRPGDRRPRDEEHRRHDDGGRYNDVRRHHARPRSNSYVDGDYHMRGPRSHQHTHSHQRHEQHARHHPDREPGNDIRRHRHPSRHTEMRARLESSNKDHPRWHDTSSPRSRV